MTANQAFNCGGILSKMGRSSLEQCLPEEESLAIESLSLFAAMEINALIVLCRDWGEANPDLFLAGSLQQGLASACPCSWVWRYSPWTATRQREAAPGSQRMYSMVQRTFWDWKWTCNGFSKREYLWCLGVRWVLQRLRLSLLFLEERKC